MELLTNHECRPLKCAAKMRHFSTAIVTDPILRIAFEDLYTSSEAFCSYFLTW